MAYKNGFIVWLVSNGKVLREFDDGKVLVPFGTEYQINFKNTDPRRALVTVYVDGQVAVSQLVISGNSESSLKGILDAKTNIAHNSFKFIEKTDQIAAHRGNREEDGLIKIEYQWENPPIPYRYGPNISWENDIQYGSSPRYFKSLKRDNDVGAVRSINQMMGFNCNVSNDNGITVAGEVVDQKFGTTFINGTLTNKETIVLQLKGRMTNSNTVAAPVTVQAVQCPTCGKYNISSHRFCSDCGTCLV